MPETEVKYICKGPRVEDGGRIPCGNDNTDLVLSAPVDGEFHGVECPKCGTVTRVLRTLPDTP